MTYAHNETSRREKEGGMALVRMPLSPAIVTKQ
jgi:hypothetical protein